MKTMLLNLLPHFPGPNELRYQLSGQWPLQLKIWSIKILANSDNRAGIILEVVGEGTWLAVRLILNRQFFWPLDVFAAAQITYAEPHIV